MNPHLGAMGELFRTKGKNVQKALESVSTMAEVDEILNGYRRWLGNYRQTVNA